MITQKLKRKKLKLCEKNLNSIFTSAPSNASTTEIWWGWAVSWRWNWAENLTKVFSSQGNRLT